MKNRVASSSVRVGEDAGASSASSAVSIGPQSGNFAGNNSVGLGNLANYNNDATQGGQTARSIVINATGQPLAAPRSDTLVIGPIEEDNSNIICMMGANVLSSITEACEITRTSLLKLVDSNVHISTNVSIANDTILFRPNGNGSFRGDIDINATLDVGGASSFGGAMTLDNTLETIGTSSFGGDMTINSNVTQTGESFIMNDGTSDKMSLTHNGNSSFSGTMTAGAINSTSGTVNIYHASAKLRVGTGTGAFNATINQDGTSSFVGAMQINNTLTVAQRATLNNGLSVSATESSSFAGVVRFDDTSSFGGIVTLNNDVDQKGGTFSMFDDDTTKKVEFTRSGDGSFLGTLEASAINCTGSAGHVDIYHVTDASLRVGTDLGNLNATINQSGNGSFAGTMDIGGTSTVGGDILSVNGNTTWNYDDAEKCKLTVGASTGDSVLLIRGDLKINSGENTNAKITSAGVGEFLQVTCPNFNGNANFGAGEITAGDFIITSDERLKSDINKIPKALDKVKELSGYTYTINEKESAGVIAQELLKVLPESVTTRDDGYYAVSYHGLIGLLIEAVKELSEKVK